MSDPKFKLLPCVFCTLGYNSYVVGHKLLNKSYRLITAKRPALPEKVTAKMSAEK